MTVSNIPDLSLFKERKLIHTSLVSEIILLTDTSVKKPVCLKSITRTPPKPHSPLRELEILKMFRDIYPHDNIIKFISAWKDSDNWNITFPYYKQNLSQIMLQHWEWYIPYEDSKPRKKKYLDNLLFLGLNKTQEDVTIEESYKNTYGLTEEKFVLEKNHFLVNKIPVSLILKIWKDITSALKHLDRHQIMHRDIKPENILYDEGNDLFILIDFGISTGFKSIKNEAKSANQTLNVSDEIYKKDISSEFSNNCVINSYNDELQEHVPAPKSVINEDLLKPDGITDVGTSIYKPLEVLIGIKEYDNRLDIWSFMVMMHQLCVPFISAYSLDPDFYDFSSEADMSLDAQILQVCDRFNKKDNPKPHMKHELNFAIRDVPSLIEDGSYLIKNEKTGKFIMCEGSDISLLSSIHKIYGCPLQSQFPMGLSSMAWVYMYNNSDNPEKKYFEDDLLRQKFMKKYVFGLVNEVEHISSKLIKMCHFDYSKRFNIRSDM